MTRKIVLLVLASCAFTAAACALFEPKGDSGDLVIGPDVGHEHVVAPGDLTREQRIGAMMSIRGHATLDDEDLSGLPIMSLVDAAQILAADEGPRADSRRLRAAAALAARSLARQEPIVSGSRLSQINQALGTLGIGPSRLSQLRAEVDARYPLVLDGPWQIDVPWLEIVIIGTIADLFQDVFADYFGGPCQWWPAAPCGCVTQPGQVPVTLDVKVRVDIPLEEVAEHIDPQQWDECSDFWDPPPDATNVVMWDPATSSAVDDPNPPQIGTHHPDDLLLNEEFGCGYQCGNADFELLLCTNTRCEPDPSPGVDCAGADEYHVSYRLPLGTDGQCSCSGGNCPAPCSNQNTKWWFTNGLIGTQAVTPCIDEGDLHAERDPNNTSYTIVEATKSLHFDPSSLNATLRIAWGLAMDEMIREMGELACCLP